MKIEVDGVTYLPAVDISELPTKVVPFISKPVVVIDDLESVAITKPCECVAKVEELEVENASLRSMMSDADHAFKQYGKNCDKVVELEAKVRELEEENEESMKVIKKIACKPTSTFTSEGWRQDAIYRVESLVSMVKKLRSELSTLRERLNLIVDAVSCGLDQTVLPEDDDEAHAWVEQQVRTLREQGKWELGEPLTLEEWSQLIDEPVIYNTSAGLRQDVARGKPFMENCVYLDTRPLPTLPEPEAVPEVPKFKGVVRRRNRRSEFIFVNEVGLSAVYGITPSGTKDGSNVYDVELYDHPEVPNTPELIAALEPTNA